jgi:hypothetical protein
MPKSSNASLLTTTIALGQVRRLLRENGMMSAEEILDAIAPAADRTMSIEATITGAISSLIIAKQIVPTADEPKYYSLCEAAR